MKLTTEFAKLTAEEEDQLLTLIRICHEIAGTAHEGQLRQDGIPYITHPEAVAESLQQDLDRYQARMLEVDRRSFLLAIALGWVHDVFEDCEHRGYTFARFDEIFAAIPAGLRAEFRRSVEAITKQDGEAYVDYLKRVLNDKVARMAKIHDITHNLSNNMESRKNRQRREKYELALAVLEGTI